MTENSIAICFARLPTISEWIHSEEFGTIGRQTELLAEEFANRDHDVTVVAEPQPTLTVSEDEIELVTVPADGDTRVSTYERAAAYIEALQKADADVYCVRGKCDILPIVWKYAEITNNHYVLHVTADSDIANVRETNEHTKHDHDVFERAITEVDALVAQTERQQHAVQNRYNRSASVIPNGYNIPSDERISSHKEKTHFLWIDRLLPERNPTQFLDLAKQFPDQQFEIYGPVREGNEFHEHVHSRAREYDNVNITRFASRNEKIKLYQNALALVNTAETIDFPVTFPEAWKYGTPTISIQDIDETLPSDSCHTVAGDFEGLVTEIERCTCNTETANVTSHKCQKKMESTLTIEQIVKDYKTLLKNT